MPQYKPLAKKIKTKSKNNKVSKSEFNIFLYFCNRSIKNVEEAITKDNISILKKNDIVKAFETETKLTGYGRELIEDIYNRLKKKGTWAK